MTPPVVGKIMDAMNSIAKSRSSVSLVSEQREEETQGVLCPGGIVPLDVIDHGTNPEESMAWLHHGCLIVVVVGASGDLAKKKTYPSLLNLYDDNLLPSHTLIIGYARSSLTDDELRDRIRPYLLETDHSPEVVERFLRRCVYQGGKSYGDIDAYRTMNDTMMIEFENRDRSEVGYNNEIKVRNRLFYFAIPPNVFAETALAIKETCMQDESKGWTRLIVEKPFGRDLESFEELNKTLAEHFTEEHLYRIDHYLGKEMVQNLAVMRFSNILLEKVWNHEHIKTVIFTFKEPFGTQGRGGYFDKYGIIRDILQNHLLQVLTLLAMEAPSTLEGPDAAEAIRDAKVAVLNAIDEIQLDDVVLGQYEGYADDPTIEDKDTNTPTYATIKLNINTPRWKGVPFIMKAGKALNERKAEIRIQFKEAPNCDALFQGTECPRNEFVMRVQPNEAVYMKTNVKTPGFTSKPIQSELEVNYDTRFFAHMKEANPDAYTRLILDVLQGRHSSFVRDDELRRAWEIFTPLLHKIENDNVKPIVYKEGSRGPKESDEFITRVAGYIRNEDYTFYESAVARKTEGTDTKPAPRDPNRRKEIPENELCDIGVFGLAVMGENFSLRIAEQGFKVCVGNRSHGKVDATVERAKKEGNLPVIGAQDPEDLVAHLKTPRVIVILVQAGRPVDDTISSLSRHMEQGDLIIDAGDEWFRNSIRRSDFLQTKGIQYIGMGMSGGEEGARRGPSLMIGGPKKAYDDLVLPIFSKCAANPGPATGPCVGYLGPCESGHYVKMVHNAIEYCDLQLIAEAYDILKHVLGLSNEEMASVFDEWQKGELSSYLLELTSIVLRKKDDLTGSGYIVDYVVDKTGMKGTGVWAIQEASEKRVSVPTLSSAVNMRLLSNKKEDREAASKFFGNDISSGAKGNNAGIDKKQVIDDLCAAVYASKICSYAQGLGIIKAASDEYEWNLDIAECARLWTGGCVIRSKLAEDIYASLSKEDHCHLPTLLLCPEFANRLKERIPAWRRTAAVCVSNGIGCPSTVGSLTFFDTYRRSRLPANLTQAQRDFFGGHTYERIDKEGRFHTAWTDSHMDIGKAEDREYGVDDVERKS